MKIVKVQLLCVSSKEPLPFSPASLPVSSTPLSLTEDYFWTLFVRVYRLAISVRTSCHTTCSFRTWSQKKTLPFLSSLFILSFNVEGAGLWNHRALIQLESSRKNRCAAISDRLLRIASEYWGLAILMVNTSASIQMTPYANLVF